jgi:hypothetical protein
MGWLQILLVLWSCCQSGLVDLVLPDTLRLCIFRGQIEEVQAPALDDLAPAS